MDDASSEMEEILAGPPNGGAGSAGTTTNHPISNHGNHAGSDPAQ
ncbi:MAG: hypothetical protein ACI867_000738 [Glaciecola sp.]